MGSFKVRGVWGGSGEAGTTRESVAEYVQRLADHGFNAVFMGVKEGDGRVCWPSERFPEIVKPEYRDFDFPAVLQEECAKRGVEAHAWFIDYFEGEHNVPNQRHPEWSARNRMGLPTSDETLRGKRYSSTWMCPARRPGYTDQWLVPLYEDFAKRYDFVTLHHDYIRYPGDAAPDQYCFCDYCLEEIPKWAGFINPPHPDEPFYHELYDREYLEAHWEQSPRVLPANWDKLARQFKADFLLEGSFFQGGRYDLDYFFYAYRMHQVERFARECHEAVTAANPNTGISAAIFKNPIHSGRFIGQDWRRMAPYIDIAIPMDYRDHYPGTFEQYLDLLAHSVNQQKEWASGYKSLYIGVAINFLFKEEDEARREGKDVPYPAEKLERVAERLQQVEAEGLILFSEWQLGQFGVWDMCKKLFA